MAIFANNDNYLEQTDFRIYTSVDFKDSVDGLIGDDEIKTFARQYDDFQLEDLRSFVFASIDYAEQYTGRFFSPAIIRGEFKDYYGELYLPYAPNSITSLKGEDINGTLQDVTYIFSKTRSTIKINMMNYAGFKNFVVTYNAGYEVSQVPDSIRYGIKRLAATMCESRQDEVFGITSTPSVIQTNRFFDLYRVRGA